MLTPSQLTGDEIPPEVAQTDDLHIYLICRRPAVSLVPDTLNHDGENLSGELRFQVEGTAHHSPFTFPAEIPADFTVRSSEYPFRKIELVEAGGGVEFTIQAWLLPFLTAHADPRIANLEVVYVGQAFGDGNRTAFDRLRSHSTLQKILADCNAKRPDDEVVILMFKYELNGVISLFSPGQKSQEEMDADKNHWVSIHQNPIPEKHQISIAEAGLIRYFRPFYNKHFTDQFPVERQKLLEECYQLDFSALTIEINTEDLGARIFSSERGPGQHHIANFDLHDLSVRRSFFSSFFVDDNVGAQSGPLF